MILTVPFLSFGYFWWRSGRCRGCSRKDEFFWHEAFLARGHEFQGMKPFWARGPFSLARGLAAMGTRPGPSSRSPSSLPRSDVVQDVRLRVPKDAVDDAHRDGVDDEVDDAYIGRLPGCRCPCCVSQGCVL